MLRPILSIVGGLVVAFALVFVSDAVFHAMSGGVAPAPDMNDKTAMAAYVASQPRGALAAVLLGWTVAVFAGAFIAARFGGRGERPGWALTGLFLLATASNFLMIPHPLWMMVAAVALIVAAGWLASRLGARPQMVTTAP